MEKFYDTCSLLELQDDAFNSGDKFYLSSITLEELENIKTSGTKDEETKWRARRLLHLLESHEGQYEVLPYYTAYDEEITKLGFRATNDSRIAMTAWIKVPNMPFYTADLACKHIAQAIGLNAVYSEEEPDDNYKGFLIVTFDDRELADFYAETLPKNDNKYGLIPNQYLLIKYNDDISDKYKWYDGHYEQVQFVKAQSKMFGKIIPKDHDVYQQLALDSLIHNQITMLRGPAGSGKSYLAFGHMFSLLEKGEIDKIIIFCNTVATKGSAKLGFYPGSRTEKLLDSQIGNLLESKIGDRCGVEQLIDDGSLVLLPLADIRGYDTSGTHAAVYISEAQNMDIELMRLALQRIGEDSICIIDGDDKAQVDMSMYAGSHNGMKRVSKIFRGAPFYGEVTLQNIHRSPIAKLAQQL